MTPVIRSSVFVLFSALWFSGSAMAEVDKVPAPTRQDVLERQLPIGATQLKTRVAKIIFPEGYKTPLHTHEGPGPRYVVRGQVRIEEGGASKVYGPGDVFWETGTWMSAENVGQGDVEIVIIELVTPK